MVERRSFSRLLLLATLIVVGFVVFLWVYWGIPLSPYLYVMSQNVRKHRSLYIGWLTADSLKDLANINTIRYHVLGDLWDERCASACSVTALVIYRPRDEEIVVLFWLGEGTVHRVLVGYMDAEDKPLAQSVLEEVRSLVGADADSVPPHREPLFDALAWLERGWLRGGTTISKRKTPNWLVLQSRERVPTNVFCYWEADETEAVLSVGVHGS